MSGNKFECNECGNCCTLEVNSDMSPPPDCIYPKSLYNSSWGAVVENEPINPIPTHKTDEKVHHNIGEKKVEDGIEALKKIGFTDNLGDENYLRQLLHSFVRGVKL